MVPGGRLQDRIGPRRVASLGGLLAGLGLILASQTTTFWGYALGFGIVAGTGIGFGYASTTPPAVKWFPATRTGLIAGIVVAGSALSGVWIPPLAKIVIVAYGVPVAVFALGIAVMVLVVLLAQLLVSPPKGYVAAKSEKWTDIAAKNQERDYFGPKEMLATESVLYAVGHVCQCRRRGIDGHQQACPNWRGTGRFSRRLRSCNGNGGGKLHGTYRVWWALRPAWPPKYNVRRFSLSGVSDSDPVDGPRGLGSRPRCPLGASLNFARRQLWRLCRLMPFNHQRLLWPEELWRTTLGWYSPPGALGDSFCRSWPESCTIATAHSSTPIMQPWDFSYWPYFSPA